MCSWQKVSFFDCIILLLQMCMTFFCCTCLQSSHSAAAVARLSPWPHHFTGSGTGSGDSVTLEGNANPQDPPPPPSLNNPPAVAPPVSPRSPGLPIHNAPKPPRPNKFEKVGDPILEPEFNYVVYMVMEARKAGLKDDLNDFEEDEGRPIEIHEVWTKLGQPLSFKAFQSAQKGKGPVPPKPSVDMQSTSTDQPDVFTGTLSSKFGLPEAALKAFSSKAVARAQRSSNLPKDPPIRKYKPLKGAAKEEASQLIDQSLTSLLQLSEKYGTDPTAAMKLFQKKLDFFSSSLWDMWEMHHAVKRATKGWDNNEEHEEEEEDGEQEGEEDEEQEGEAGPSDGTRGDDEAPGSDMEDGSQSTSITQINSFYFYPHCQVTSYIEASGSKGRQAKLDAATYNNEKAAAMAAGPEAFTTWASGVAAKGYTAITSLRQKISNDQTRAKAAATASDELDAFVSQFFNSSFIGPPKHYGLPSGSKRMGPVWPCCCRVHHWSCKAYAYQL